MILSTQDSGNVWRWAHEPVKVHREKHVTDMWQREEYGIKGIKKMETKSLGLP
jgi:hypothetical protein